MALGDFTQVHLSDYERLVAARRLPERTPERTLNCIDAERVKAAILAMAMGTADPLSAARSLVEALAYVDTVTKQEP